jgi:magnesium chelatase family protein
MKGKYALVHTIANIANKILPIRVEVYLRRGIPGFQVVGLPSRNIRESKDRIRAAIESSGYEYPFQNITINLSPSSKKKDGSQFDLTIAVGILIASQQLDLSEYENLFLIGELALNGDILPVSNISELITFQLPTESTLLIPKINYHEMKALGKSSNLIGIDKLSEINNKKEIEDNSKSKIYFIESEFPTENNFSTINNSIKNDTLYLYDGQRLAFEAMVYALMGHHHILITGIPGSGKTMMAEIANIIQSKPNPVEWNEIYNIHQQFQAMNPNFPYRPYRIPHHSITANGLLGGGSKLQLGEISLAHKGILVLDEFGEIKSSILQNLREPMESGIIKLHRNSQWAEFPSRFQLIALSNLCPCGNFNSGKSQCICKKDQIRTYLSKISGPILERFDIIAELHKSLVINSNNIVSEMKISLSNIQEKIQNVRLIQWERFKDKKIHSNSEIPSSQIFEYLNWDNADIDKYNKQFKYLEFSFREKLKVLRLARTIADSKIKEKVTEDDLIIAIGLREGSKTIKFLAA